MDGWISTPYNLKVQYLYIPFGKVNITSPRYPRKSKMPCMYHRQVRSGAFLNGARVHGSPLPEFDFSHG